VNLSWQRINSKLVHQNPWWQVYKDKVIRPDGSQSYFYWDNAPSFVVVLPITKTGEIYLVGQQRYVLNQYSWEVPEGGIEKTETPLQAAKRELWEETGLRAKKFKLLTKWYNSNGHSNQQAWLYLAQDLSLNKTKELGAEPGEILKRKKVSLVELKKMIKLGKIDDGPTILAFGYYQTFVEGKAKKG